jgi:trimethylamine--corrinoid protein Co-methyltransferase
VEQGQPILVNKATERKEKILSKPARARFAPDVDAVIRSRFNIHLN